MVKMEDKPHMKNNTGNKPKTTEKKAKKHKLNFFWIFVLAIIVIAAVGSWQFKNIKHLLNQKYLQDISSKVDSSDNENINNDDVKSSKNLNDENDNITKKQDESVISYKGDTLNQEEQNLESELKVWQEQVNKKLSYLTEKDKRYKTASGLSREKVAELQQNLNLYKNSINDIKISLQLINALENSDPFNKQLKNFMHTKLYKKYNLPIKNIENTSDTGVKTPQELNAELANANKKIIRYYLSLDTTMWGKVKYFLSYAFILQKTGGFKAEDSNNISNTLYFLHYYIKQGQLNKALKLACSTPLRQMPELQGWMSELKQRQNINSFINDLQEYLIHTMKVDDESDI